MMDDKTVRSLEREIEKAIIDVLCRMGLKRLPLMPTQQNDAPDGEGRNNGL